MSNGRLKLRDGFIEDRKLAEFEAIRAHQAVDIFGPLTYTWRLEQALSREIGVLRVGGTLDIALPKETIQIAGGSRHGKSGLAAVLQGARGIEVESRTRPALHPETGEFLYTLESVRIRRTAARLVLPRIDHRQFKANAVNRIMPIRHLRVGGLAH